MTQVSLSGALVLNTVKEGQPVILATSFFIKGGKKYFAFILKVFPCHCSHSAFIAFLVQFYFVNE